MKVVISFGIILFITFVATVPVRKDVVTIVEEEYKVLENGYTFKYELSDGQFREETGTIINPGTPDEYLSVKGSYSFTDADHITYLTEYTADKDGYNATTSETEEPSVGISQNVLLSLVG